MTRVLYGAEFAAPIKEKIKEAVYKPSLLIVTSSDDKASASYVKNKIKTAEEVGIKADVMHIENADDVAKLMNIIESTNGDELKIIIQQPYGNHVKKELTKCQSLISSCQDVDGINKDSNYIPCTALGVMEMLKDYDLTGKHVVIVGRSKLVGKPLIDLCLKRNATVTSCNSYTQDLASYTNTADVLIVAVGIPKLITAEHVKQGVVVIDVGINRDENGKLCGDVDFESVAPLCEAISPVPKGVGVMTCTMLMANVVDLY